MSTTPRANSQLSDLTLLVERPLALQEEVFLQHGLTLGRAASNAICINHPDVDHIHARVQKQPDGSFALQCEGNATVTSMGGAPARLRRVALIAGTAFQLGDAIIRCRQQAHASALMRENLWETSCPFCQASLAGQPSDLTVCPECGLAIFLARAGDFTGWLPRQVGAYAVRRYVARGGMGLVLQALDEDGTPVAIKVPNPQVAANPRWRQRFEREVETLQRLNHPNLIRLLDHGKICELRWVVMEWVEWGDNDQTLAHWLKAWLDVGQVPPLADLSLILQQIIAGLEYLHRMGVIHRDLKPTNVLLSGGGEVKLIDFGLARELDGGDNTSLTQTGATTGTMAYMAPEQWHGGELTPAVDVYALGVMWHELLTGKRPGRRLKLTTERADCPPEWADALEQCLEDEPGLRPKLERLRSVLFKPPMVQAAKGLGGAAEEGDTTGKPGFRKTRGPEADVTARVGSSGQGYPMPALWNPRVATYWSFLLSPAFGAHLHAENAQTLGRSAEAQSNRRWFCLWLAFIPATVSVLLIFTKFAALIGVGFAGMLIAWYYSSAKPHEKYVRETLGNRYYRKGWMLQLVTGFYILCGVAMLVPIAIYFLILIPNQERRIGAASQSANGRQTSVLKPGSEITTFAAGHPFVNTLGMKFVPVPGTDVLFSVWETRKQDYEAYARAVPGVDGSWQHVVIRGQPVSFAPDHPVVATSWDDAKAFCVWLTEKERREGSLPAGAGYRLPTDLEWSAAVGLPHEGGATPEARNMKIKVYPWGPQFPPPDGAGNFADSTSSAVFGAGWTFIQGYRDGFATTSPVGSFAANQHGLFDLAGNVWEWCEDFYYGKSGTRVLRGGSWDHIDSEYLLSSFRYHFTAGFRGYGAFGFRCVLVGVAGKRIAPNRAVPPSAVVPVSVPTLTPGLSVASPATATKENPFTNSLGMKFVPVAGTEMLFSIWDTRVQDYAAFASVMGRAWDKPFFAQGPTHPAVNVSWDDSKWFSKWLTEKERLEGRLTGRQEYRLPYDWEWSVAVGLKEARSGKPVEKSAKINGYPWQGGWPPPIGAGNYDQSLKVDEFDYTSPVGSFAANVFGIYDMGGNVWNWCEEQSGGIPDQRTIRGGSWAVSFSVHALASYRDSQRASYRAGSIGFRLVLTVAGEVTRPDTHGQIPATESRIPKFTLGSCCDKAQRAGRECFHKCCVEAALSKLVCEKCNKAPGK